MSNKQLPADVQEQKFVKALDVKDFDHQLWPGDIIKIYGKETSITGFSAQFNDALGKWETIIHTVGRGDPFERTLSDIEVLEEQPRSYEQRAALMLQPQHPGAVWVKASERLPEQKREVIFRKKGVSRTAKPFYVNEYLFNLIVEGVILIEYYIGCPLSEIEWLDESAAAGISQDAHEKEIMMQAFDKVRQIFEGRQWVLDGRGCYPYNDDRYKEEVRYMYNEFDEVVKDTWANIQSKSVDYRKAIIAEYLATPAAGREEAVEFAEWCATIAFFDDEYRLWELLREGEFINGQFRFTTKELYELFKQKEK